MKYTITVEADDDYWHQIPEISKRIAFKSGTVEAPGYVSAVSVENLAGAPHGFYRAEDGHLWYVDSFGAYWDGNSYPTAPEFQASDGPFTYLGYDRPADSEQN